MTPRTLDELRKRFRYHLAGLALYGLVSEVKEGPLNRAAHALNVPEEVDRLLAAIHAFYTEPAPPNGKPAPHPAQQVRK